MQPTPYVPVTNFAQAERDNAGGRSTVSTSGVDAELDAIALTFSQLLANLAAIQRDDLKLVDGLIEPYNLSQACRAFLMATKWTARGLWASGQAYAVNDLVDVSGVGYVCAAAHTSTVFATDYAAGRWQIFTTSTNAAALPFAPTAAISSTNVQAAIQEVDAKARGRDLTPLAALFGAL